MNNSKENIEREILNELDNFQNDSVQKVSRPFTAVPKKNLSLRKTSSKGRIMTARPKVEEEINHNTNKSRTHRVNLNNQTQRFKLITLFLILFQFPQKLSLQRTNLY